MLPIIDEMVDCAGVQDIKRLPTTMGTKYRLGKKLGQGAFGVVLQAWNEDTAEQVAVKRVHLRSDDLSHNRRVLREIRLMSLLKHRNVLAFLEHIFDPVTYSSFVVTELIEGGSLLHFMRESGYNQESHSANVVSQVLQGLAFIHSNGVVHRDIKAANLMINKAGTVVIGDFGLAQELRSIVQECSIVGSPYWLPPEVIERGIWHLNSDVWSLGCTLVELLTGHPPNARFNPYCAMYKACQEPFVYDLDASKSVGAFLAQCFVKLPEMRGSSQTLLHDEWIPTAAQWTAPAKRS